VIEQGRAIYNSHCYFCHGYSGDAMTVASSYLDPPPRDFTATDVDALSRARMIESVSRGRPGTAMMGFAGQLSVAEIAAVVEFIRDRFMSGREETTRYHTVANGWLDFSRYAAAFPFVSGELAIDDDLDSGQQQGLQLFLSTCLTCHEGRSLKQPPLQLEPRPVSFPRGGYSPQQLDAVSAASPYARHDQPPRAEDLSSMEKKGEILFQANCAFCHAADGSGRNWIGSFLQEHPRDLTDAKAMHGMTRARLHQVIENGLEGTTMPAWKSVLDGEQIDAIAAYVMRVFVKRDGDAK